jgi:hypothetical protein
MELSDIFHTTSVKIYDEPEGEAAMATRTLSPMPTVGPRRSRGDSLPVTRAGAPAALDRAGDSDASPPAAREDGVGFLLVFLVTTMGMVAGIWAMAAVGAWWALLAAVAVHWAATCWVIARINGLLDDA